MIRKTAHGFYVIEGDEWISKWADECGHLGHDAYLLNQILPLIPEGGVVIDAGAFIGDHSAPYADRVGRNGWVLAFEPNPEARDCLHKNVAWRVDNLKEGNIFVFGRPLSDKVEEVDLQVSPNAGASHLRSIDSSIPPSQRLSGLKTGTLDCAWGEFWANSQITGIERLDFVKIDAEGFELKILKGAVETLREFRPKILVEINTQRLLENGANVFDILSFCRQTMGDFSHSTIPQEAKYGDPQYDLLILPNHLKK